LFRPFQVVTGCEKLVPLEDCFRTPSNSTAMSSLTQIVDDCRRKFKTGDKDGI